MASETFDPLLRNDGVAVLTLYCSVGGGENQHAGSSRRATLTMITTIEFMSSWYALGIKPFPKRYMVT